MHPCLRGVLLASVAPSRGSRLQVRLQVRAASYEADRTALCVHGAGGGGWEFDLWREPFAKQGWRLVAPDLQPRAQGGYALTTLDDYADQVAAWLDEYQPGALLGASMGGPLVLLGAARRPACLAATVLINSVIPPPWSHPPTVPKDAEQEGGVLRWKGSSLESTARALPDSTPEVHRWACSRWRDESGRVLQQLRSLHSDHLHDAWANIAAPASAHERLLFVIGDEDHDCPPQAQREWATAWGAAAISHPGMSHCGPLLGVAAPGVADEVATWLNGVVGDELAGRS